MARVKLGPGFAWSDAVALAAPVIDSNTKKQKKMKKYELPVGWGSPGLHVLTADKVLKKVPNIHRALGLFPDDEREVYAMTELDRITSLTKSPVFINAHYPMVPLKAAKFFYYWSFPSPVIDMTIKFLNFVASGGPIGSYSDLGGTPNVIY